MQPLTFALTIVSALSLYSLFFTIYKSDYQWNAAGTALFLGLVSWLSAGLSGVVNATIAFDQIVHNSLWIVGHFHQMALINIGFVAFAAVYAWLPDWLGRPLYSEAMAKWQVWLTFVFATANSVVWLIEGLEGAPAAVRRAARAVHDAFADRGRDGDRPRRDADPVLLEHHPDDPGEGRRAVDPARRGRGRRGQGRCSSGSSRRSVSRPARRSGWSSTTCRRSRGPRCYADDDRADREHADHHDACESRRRRPGRRESGLHVGRLLRLPHAVGCGGHRHRRPEPRRREAAARARAPPRLAGQGRDAVVQDAS